MVSSKFGRKSMPTGPRLHLAAPSFATAGKRGAARGNAQRGSRSRQRGRRRGGPGRPLPPPLPNAYPNQPSKTLATVLRNQRKRGGWQGSRGGYNNSNFAELRKQFPVSSGSQHRAKENPGPQVPAHLKLRLDEDYNYSTPTHCATSASTAPRFGMKMLQKMGWSPGEGLGKNKEGTTEPLIPDGLYAQEYQPKKDPVEVVEDLSAKHPVMALTELCTRYKWPAPKFEVVAHTGPDHKKNFLMKVIVNGQEFKPGEAASSKKQAKAEAAALFLESIGLYNRKKAPQWH